MKELELREGIRVNRKYNTLLKLAWVGVIVFTLLTILLSLTSAPDEVRKKDTYYDGVITKLSQGAGSVSSRPGRGGGHGPSYYIDVKVDNRQAVNNVVTISSWYKFFVGQHIKVWEYRGNFYIDEYDNMNPLHIYPFLIGDIICIMAIITVYLKRKK